MADDFVRIEISPAPQEFKLGLEKWARLISDWRPAWRAIAGPRGLLPAHFEAQFKTEGRQTGQRFQRLSPSYAPQKARRYPGRPILTASGEMRKAFTETPSRRFTKTAMSYGPSGRKNRQKAQAHQDGTPILPARPPVRFSSNLRDKRSLGFAVSQVLQAHVIEARKKALGVESNVSPEGTAGIYRGNTR